MDSKAIPQHLTLLDKSFELTVPQSEIIFQIDSLADRINADYSNGTKDIPLIIGILNGAFMFLSELVQRLSFACEVSFIRVASYCGTKSTNNVTEILGLKEDIRGRHVILVEDIIETGGSITTVTDMLAKQSPASLEVATLMMKPNIYKGHIPIKYCAFEIADDFIVGFGMDYRGLGRNYPAIYTIKENEDDYGQR